MKEEVEERGGEDEDVHSQSRLLERAVVVAGAVTAMVLARSPVRKARGNMGSREEEEEEESYLMDGESFREEAEF